MKTFKEYTALVIKAFQNQSITDFDAVLVIEEEHKTRMTNQAYRWFVIGFLVQYALSTLMGLI